MENMGLKTNVTTSIDVNVRMASKEFNILLNDALEFGIKFLVAEQLAGDYPECRLLGKVEKLKILLEENTEELEKVKDELGELRNKNFREDNKLNEAEEFIE